jgi:hypothetical protein
MSEEPKKKKTTRKVGYADEPAPPCDPDVSAYGSPDESLDIAEDSPSSESPEYDENGEPADTDRV